MADTLMLQGGQITLTTEEGATHEYSEAELEDLFRSRLVPPLAGQALPDGVKFVEWREPRLVVVHQSPPCLRRLSWIAADSPVPYGPGTVYRHIEVSLPYAITLAAFDACGNRLQLSGANELYFTNRPLRSRSDKLGYPALLNISKVQRGSRTATWICTQHLGLRPGMTWPDQLDALVRHTFDGSYNLSSEHHEGASFYGESRSIDGLHPIEEWSRRSKENAMFGLGVSWLPAPFTVGEVIDELLKAVRPPMPGLPPPSTEFHLIPRLLNFIQTRKKPK